MVKSEEVCLPSQTNAKKYWHYDEYYRGEDLENQRSGEGENHWVSAESMEWYEGSFVSDIMHGVGTYRWRHRGRRGDSATYEGHFYFNRKHGYGTMSYADGSVFRGLYHSDSRWGPGVESQASLREDVGLWRGRQLFRLAWRPPTSSVVPELVSEAAGRTLIQGHRRIMTAVTQAICDSNSALDLLKHYGMEPLAANKRWREVYSKTCTDPISKLCYKAAFDDYYYGGKIHTLIEVYEVPDLKEDRSSLTSGENNPENSTYFAWNNNDATVHMMKHCYQHEEQRQDADLDLMKVLTGPRKRFKPAGKHEMDCRTVLMASYLGHTINVAQLVNEENVYPDIADMQGNTALMYATCGNQVETIHFLVEAGAKVNAFNDSCCTPLGVALIRYAAAQQDVPPAKTVLALLPEPTLPSSPLQDRVLEWNITRDLPPAPISSIIPKSQSKNARISSARKMKSVSSIKEVSRRRIHANFTAKSLSGEPEYNSDNEIFTEERRLYEIISNEYVIRVNNLFYTDAVTTIVPYLFEVHDIVKEAELSEAEPKKLTEKVNLKKSMSKMKTSKDVIWQNLEKDEFGPVNSAERIKSDKTVLMASYLGHTINVAQLVNEENVYPDIADMQGNTALMYATCGNQVETIHFLVEAGAKVNAFNDSCCTPLGVALIRYAAAQQDVPPAKTVLALLPEPTLPSSPLQDRVLEWNITRDLPPAPISSIIPKSQSKNARISSARKMKSVSSIKEVSRRRIHANFTAKSLSGEPEYNSDNEIFTEERRLYEIISNEYVIRVNNLFYTDAVTTIVPYLFEVHDIVKEAELSEAEPKKLTEKVNLKKSMSKMKTSKDVIWQNLEKDEFGPVNSAERIKSDNLARCKLTIMQLLSDGADPKLVYCPQPALVIALASRNAEVVRQLVQFGANVNEIYPQIYGYTPLDIAMSHPLTQENLELVKTLLEIGANPDHQLKVEDSQNNDSTEPGPTLLHVLLSRNTENENEEEIRKELLQLLLQYGCNALSLYKGRSAIDVAMTKQLELLQIFIKCPKTDLNGIINSSHQTILTKMFSLAFCKTVVSNERMETLTSLLLFGADPLIDCEDCDQKFENLFAYAHNILDEITPKPVATGPKPDWKGKKLEDKPDPKSKKVNDAPYKKKVDEKVSSKSAASNKMVDDIADYRQGLDLLTECARMLHIRWIQAQLLKELAEIVDKYKHRSWHMIMNEHKNQKKARLWLTSQRCLEIWDILKTTKKKLYADGLVLKHLICIVQYYNTKHTLSPKLTFTEKEMIEKDVACLIREHNQAKVHTPEINPWKRPYVKPELVRRADKKFNICFECSIPLTENSIKCKSCGVVSFCSMQCVKDNTQRFQCHPCSGYLIKKYFTNSELFVTDI